jgi:ketosteroid isomerase-like protein
MTKSGGKSVNIEELVDRESIRELSARYNYLVDNGPKESLSEVWAPDGVFEVTGMLRLAGKDELTSVLDDGPGRTLHVTSDQTIEVTGDTAKQTSTLVLYRRRPDRSRNDLMSTGRYVDVLVRTPGGWRFQSRTVTLDTQGRVLGRLRSE